MVDIALFIQPGRGASVVAATLAAHARRHALPWRLHIQPTSDGARHWLEDLVAMGRIQAAVGFVDATQIGRDLPVVSFRSQSRRAARVLVDDQAIGALAAETLIKAGYRRLICQGPTASDTISARAERHRGFLARARSVPGVQALRLPRDADSKRLSSFLRDLVLDGLPTALFGYQDQVALWLLHEIALAGLAVPEDIGVIGVEDTAAAATSTPTLTSVQLPWAAMAYESALALHRLLCGAAPGPAVTLSAPGVSLRASTRRTAVPTDDARRELERRVAAMAVTGTVASLADTLGMGVRRLHKHCLEMTGRTPSALITDARMAVARSCLATTEATMDEVAAECGFSGRVPFTQAFRRIHGTSPGRWRSAIRCSPEPT
ncbi:XylR family transcriptional regulator [Planctomycetota bacterium]|nr:XylR family transcriptional regulator [Planctomycetota bacterium]